MPDDFQYVKMPDGSYGKFNAGVSDDVIRQTITKNFPDAYKQSPEAAAAANPPRAPLPKVNMMQTGAMGEQVAPITREQQNRGNDLGGVMGTIIPAALSFGATPGASLLEKGASFGRGMLKSAAVSEIGKYAGGTLGGIFGNKGAEIGREVGAVAGGIAGPFISGQMFSKLPMGLGRLAATDEETAAARSAMKVAQRASDVKAGLRKPPANISIGEIETPEARAFPRPMRPLVGTPEEWADYERKMGILEEEAKGAGMYSAARGKLGKPLDYQQRQFKSFGKINRP